MSPRGVFLPVTARMTTVISSIIPARILTGFSTLSSLKPARTSALPCTRKPRRLFPPTPPASTSRTSWVSAPYAPAFTAECCTTRCTLLISRRCIRNRDWGSGTGEKSKRWPPVSACGAVYPVIPLAKARRTQRTQREEGVGGD